ncbi:NAD(P)-dependent oxidoreductase [Streptomyces sp. NPDC058373]|uniref:NAD(P)-dependent oxidoreductase n=1 Tax=unclassified Streptomyces TaxID=2593676 RepID=UPI0036521C14
MPPAPLPADLLDRAALVVGPGTAPAVAEDLAALTGRPVLVHDAEGRLTGALGAEDAPLILVGAALPPALRGDPRVRWFHSVNAGVDALVDGGWPTGVLLTRTVGRMGERIGQYTLAWVLADCQGVPGHLARTAARTWCREPSELAAGQTALVYGTGRIGTAVAGALRAVGVRTVGVGRGTHAPGGPFDERITAEEDGERLGQARFVVDALPLTEATREFFGDARLSALRGATFLNVGRGGTVSLPALSRALTAGHVAGAVLDVLADEPPAPGHPVWELPRTTLTSHSAGITADNDITADFRSCWDALRAGEAPELAVRVGRGY